MESFSLRLPTIFGCMAALAVGFVCTIVQVSPLTCILRAVAAFTIFAAFGMVIRYLLTDTGMARQANGGDWPGLSKAENDHGLDAITPGTPVGQLLDEDGPRHHDAAQESLGMEH